MDHPNVQSLTTEIGSVDLAAALVALDFPLAKRPDDVKLEDLGSQHRAGKKSQTWHFAPVSARGENLLEVLTSWESAVSANPAPATLARLALHNYRCLKSVIAHGAPLYARSFGLCCRLTNWHAAGMSLIEPLQEPAAGGMTTHTAQAAVAITLGCPCLGYRQELGRYAYAIIPGTDNQLSPAEVQHYWHDDEWISKQTGPLALLIAVMRNREALCGMRDMCNRQIILHKRGKYALIDKHASSAQISAAARHLNC